MKNRKIILVVAICLVVAGLSFRGGMIYTNSKSSSDKFANSAQNGFNQNGITRTGNGMMRGGVNGGGLVSGEILSKDDKSMTIKLNSGGSKIVFFSPSTKVEKTVDGSIADVIVGKQITVIGVANSDGSVNATSIQLRPVLVPIKQ
jgi:cytochrome c-type biogenesis protein CcmE